MNAKRPRFVTSGGNHHRSVRSVRSGNCARVAEKTPVAGRFAVGALIYCSSSNGLSGRRVHRENPLIFGGLGLSGPVVTPDTLVVDLAPAVGVVLGVGNGDLLARLLHGGAVEIQFGEVAVEQFDVGEDPVGVDDDAAHRRAVAVSRPQ